ncbi:MAG TPA: alginate export family protein [Cytophagaceae bacterium]|jgi:hypothetical protein|nr:alginate export family protein [Cytophagaceae bacterium]
MKKNQLSKLLACAFFLFGGYAHAQYTFTGQIRTRSEYRNGAGNLLPKGSDAAFFTSQRTNLAFGYKWDKLIFYTQIRDVRVWGQDASTISNADGNKLFLHEAWGEFILANSADTNSRLKIDNLSIKVGRQELNYDDARLLGNLDWLQQGRRHDAALIKFQHKGYQVDLGAAFNQNSDAFGKAGTLFSPVNTNTYATTTTGFLIPIPGSKPNFVPTSGKNGAPVIAGVAPSTNGVNQMYKTMQFIYLKKKFGQTTVSGLVFKDDFAKWRLDSIGNATTGFAYGRNYDQVGTNSRITSGLMLTSVVGNASSAGKIAWQAFGYYQGGKDYSGNNLNAYYFGANASYQRGKFSIGPGYEMLSGNDKSSDDNHRFDPLYSTAHKFWGYMDFFYAGTGSPVAGLQNAFLKMKYAAKDLFITVDAHQFWTAAQSANRIDGGNLNKALGTEIDIVLNYNVNKFVNLELGYSTMFATSSLEYVKTELAGAPTQNATRHNAQWAYLMLNIRPDFLFTKPVALTQAPK